MATTTGGTTYVTSTDLVANYPTASLALANRVDVVASGGPNSIKTSGYTITLADILGGNKFLYNSASPGTFTLPTSGLVDGMVVNVAQIGAGALTVAGGTIVGTTVTTAQYQGLRFVYASTGTTWYSVAPFSTAPGLAIVTPTSIANSGGSSSASGGAVTFTGVSSISLNGVFTSTYANYRVVIDFRTATTTQAVNLRMRAGGTDDSAANYNLRWASLFTSYTGSATSSGTQWTSLSYGYSGEASQLVMDFTNPQLSVRTMVQSLSNFGTGAQSEIYLAGGQYAATTAFDGFSLIANSTNTLTGTARVYGYKNS